jgi:hypothetical protein
MAFTFVVEDGTGLEDANSYASVQEADDYAVTNIHIAATWEAYDDETKEYLLANATRMINAMTTWYGLKAVEEAALPIPRTSWFNKQGILIDDDVVPSEVKWATIETAIRLGAADRSFERPQDGLESLRVDDIWMTFKKGYRMSPIPDLAVQYLKGLGSVYSGGPGFPKIERV